MANSKAINKYLSELDWSPVDLSRCTNIHLSSIERILQGIQRPTWAQTMIIINKICMQYPVERHWSIYHDIADPFNKQSEDK